MGKPTVLAKGYVLSNDENFVYIIYRDGSIHMWDVSNWELISQFKSNDIPVNEVIDTEDGS